MNKHSERLLEAMRHMKQNRRIHTKDIDQHVMSKSAYYRVMKGETPLNLQLAIRLIRFMGGRPVNLIAYAEDGELSAYGRFLMKFGRAMRMGDFTLAKQIITDLEAQVEEYHLLADREVLLIAEYALALVFDDEEQKALLKQEMRRLVAKTDLWTAIEVTLYFISLSPDAPIESVLAEFQKYVIDKQQFRERFPAVEVTTIWSDNILMMAETVLTRKKYDDYVKFVAFINELSPAAYILEHAPYRRALADIERAWREHNPQILLDAEQKISRFMKAIHDNAEQAGEVTQTFVILFRIAWGVIETND